jgi:hypothetical protein
MDNQTTLYPYGNRGERGYDALDHFSIEDRPHPAESDVSLYQRHYPIEYDNASVHRYQASDYRPSRTEYRAHDYRSGYDGISARGYVDERDNFRGRGPKGYRRSDQQLKEEVCEHLMEDANVDASDITVEVESGLVTLTGSVAHRRQKYRAELIADAVHGVHDVNNWLSVSTATA